jgi:hypothetical protein
MSIATRSSRRLAGEKAPSMQTELPKTTRTARVSLIKEIETFINVYLIFEKKDIYNEQTQQDIIALLTTDTVNNKLEKLINSIKEKKYSTEQIQKQIELYIAKQQKKPINLTREFFPANMIYKSYTLSEVINQLCLNKKLNNCNTISSFTKLGLTHDDKKDLQVALLYHSAPLYTSILDMLSTGTKLKLMIDFFSNLDDFSFINVTPTDKRSLLMATCKGLVKSIITDNDTNLEDYKTIFGFLSENVNKETLTHVEVFPYKFSRSQDADFICTVTPLSFLLYAYHDHINNAIQDAIYKLFKRNKTFIMTTICPGECYGYIEYPFDAPRTIIDTLWILEHLPILDIRYLINNDFIDLAKGHKNEEGKAISVENTFYFKIIQLRKERDIIKKDIKKANIYINDLQKLIKDTEQYVEDYLKSVHSIVLSQKDSQTFLEAVQSRLKQQIDKHTINLEIAEQYLNQLQNKLSLNMDIIKKLKIRYNALVSAYFFKNRPDWSAPA